MKCVPHIALVAVAAMLIAGCERTIHEELIENEPFILDLPPGFDMPPIPEDNPLTKAGVELGKKLFFEKRLSANGTVSCASCHLPEKAFSDDTALSEGIYGRTTVRNSPSLMNVAYHPALFKDGGNPTLEIQVIAPIQDEAEMASDIHAVAERLRDEEPYKKLSERAYHRPLDAYVMTRAIASFERTLISGGSRYHRFRYQNDRSALTQSELNGWKIFSGPEASCTACHNGPDLSNYTYQNIGLYTDYTDPGRQRISLNETDRGKFKVPTLNNIALTAPYMHDGSMNTLEEVVDHFSNGGLEHQNKSEYVRPFLLSEQERIDLIAFLNALTDEQYTK